MGRYAMVREGFFTGSLVDTPPYTRIVFLLMLVQKNREGIFEGNADFISRICKISLKDAEESLVILSSPDPNSDSQEADGARIIQLSPRHWRIVNAERYDAIAGEERARAYNTAYQRHARAKAKQEAAGAGEAASALKPDEDAGFRKALGLIHTKERAPTGPEIKAWRALRKDYSIDDIIEAIGFGVNDDFWRPNILAFAPLAKRKSAGAPRKFDNLIAKQRQAAADIDGDEDGNYDAKAAADAAIEEATRKRRLWEKEHADETRQALAQREISYTGPCAQETPEERDNH